MSPSVAVACLDNELLKQEVPDIDNYGDMLKQRPSASVLPLNAVTHPPAMGLVYSFFLTNTYNNRQWENTPS